MHLWVSQVKRKQLTLCLEAKESRNMLETRKSGPRLEVWSLVVMEDWQDMKLERWVIRSRHAGCAW